MVTKLPVPTKGEYVITTIVVAAVVLAALAINYLVGP
jgi:preprotein translocase subunit SecE